MGGTFNFYLGMAHTKKTVRPDHYFLFVAIDCKEIVEAYQLKNLLESNVKQLFGRIGAAETIDVLQVENNIAHLRVNSCAYDFFMAVLCMVTKHERSPCSLRVVRVSPFLGSLASPRFLQLDSFDLINKAQKKLLVETPKKK